MLDHGAAIREQLGPAEHLLWSGQPVQGLKLRASDAFLIPFSLLWGGFAFFWEASVIASGAPWFFKLWGVPFVLVGLYIIAGRFVWDGYLRRNTFYGLTNERVLVVARGLFPKVTSLPLRGASTLTLSSRSGESGTIQFGDVPNTFPWTVRGWSGSATQTSVALELDRDVKRVYELIRQAQGEAR